MITSAAICIWLVCIIQINNAFVAVEKTKQSSHTKTLFENHHARTLITFQSNQEYLQDSHLSDTGGRVRRSTDGECDECPQLCDEDGGREAKCPCFKGFKIVPAPQYCKDVNECTEQKSLCAPGGRCINTAGSFVCRCLQGFRVTSDGRCEDIDECANLRQPCNQLCSNLPGNYTCSCYRGYSLLPGPGPGKCEDINECELQVDGCSHLCVNTPGSYLCRCPAPLQLLEDGHTCSANTKRHRKSPAAASQGKTESRTAREGSNFCQFKCLNGGTCKQGTCTCPPGLTGNLCQYDIDECSVLPYDLKCEHQCTNTFGSFQCECRQGWTLGADRRSCYLLSCTPACMGDGTCINGVCKCPVGLSGPACGVDVDECDHSPCEHMCRNTLGSFVCLCRGRWRLAADGHKCVEPPCTPHCRNRGVCRAGRCVCKPGFTGRLCQLDVNECAFQNSPCKYACVNSIGSYQCLCPPGLRLSANRTSCEPVSGDQPENKEQVDVVIEIVVEDAYSKMTHHTMERMRVQFPWASTQYHQNLHPNLQYQVISHTQIPVENLKTESIIENNKSTLKSSSHNIRVSEFLPSSQILPSPTLDLKPSSTVTPNWDQIIEKLNLGSDKIDFNLHVPNESPNEHLNPSEIEHITSSFSAIQSSSLLPSKQDDLLEPALLLQKSNLSSLENKSKVSDILSEVPDISDENVVEEDDSSLPDEFSSINNEMFESTEPLIQNLVSTSVYEYLDINQEIANSLFPSRALPRKTEDSSTIQEAENINLTLTENNFVPISSSLIETSFSSFIITSETPILPSADQEFQIIETSSIIHSPTDQILMSTVYHFTNASDNINQSKEHTPKKSKKHKYRKNKPQQKKFGNHGKNLQILNQILQSFDLQASSPGDTKNYEVIDLDDASSLPSSSGVQSVYASNNTLPMLQSLPTNRTEMDCFYARKRYKSRSSFYRDDKNCTKCVCKDGELRCAPRHCPPPHCESPLSGSCCDFCPGDCVFEQQVYLPGERFSPYLDPCRECRCEAGRPVCHDIICPALACPQEYRVQMSEECCPICVPPEPGCFWNGRFFYTGQLWVHRQGGCQACLCKAQNDVQCNPVVCVVGCQHPQFIPGDCCPLCEGCQHHGQQYDNGQTFTHPSDPCSSCQCQNGNITCFEKPCNYDCSHPFKSSGKCCPECSDCLFEGEHILNGKTHSFTHSNSSCMDCSCMDGEVRCRAADCLAGCEVEGGRHVPSGSQFSLGSDPCTRCRCQEGQVECRAEQCPVECTHGVLLPGACCLDCSNCEYKGVLYKELQVFRPPDEPCVSCLCGRGNVFCDNSCEDTISESEEDGDQEDQDKSEEIDKS